MKELEQLQKENDELRAKVEAMEYTISGKCPPFSAIAGDYRIVISEYFEQSLAYIRAEAVMSIMDNVSDFEAFGSPKMMEVRDIIDYANRIKEG